MLSVGKATTAKLAWCSLVLLLPFTAFSFQTGNRCLGNIYKRAGLVSNLILNAEENDELLDKDEQNKSSSSSSSSKTVCVIGGGWAGFSVADALSTAVENHGDKQRALKIEVLDASPRGRGGLAGGWRTEKLGRPVEAGLHGFWREYKNTFETMEKRIGLNLDDVLTSYTPSILVSESGRVALAPVLGQDDEYNADPPSIIELPSLLENVDWSNPSSSLLSNVATLLPPPLDIALLSEFDAKSPLTAADRISALGLLGVWADFGQEDSDSWKRYDKISADNLFRSVAGVSPTLYQELVSPLLHVLPMTLGYDCSAAAALSCFHVFALQARGAFDVRWCKGTISENIFNPWTEKLIGQGNVNIRGSSKVTGIEELQRDTDKKYRIQINGQESLECDAVVMAVGGTAMKNLLQCSPPLASVPGSSGWNNFRGVTCCAIRLFLRPTVLEDGSICGISTIDKAMADSPVVVCGPKIGNIPELVETGFCIYDLQRLHDEFSLDTQNTDANEKEPCLAYEVDFFRADSLTDIEDDMEVAKLALRAVSAALGIPRIDPDLILDVSVVRARNAVSHFCVDSASWSPQVKLRDSMYICGDWIDRTGHASWSTEKSVVTARQAAFALANDFGLKCDDDIKVIPAAPDTPQLSALRQIAQVIRRATPFDHILPTAPWVLAKQLFGGRM